MTDDKYSVFVSHSSEDKVNYVDDLVAEIKALGITVFYDTDVLEWGDNLKEKIDAGLKNCDLAVIVISPSYFGRDWTEYEIQTLLERQDNEKTKLIMPILYNTTKNELVEHYPTLNNILFKYSKSQSKKKLAQDLKVALEKKTKSIERERVGV